MNKATKRLVCLLLTFLLIASLSVPVFAASKPTATWVKYTTSIRRGYSATYKFYLRSNSYYKTSGKWRSEFDLYIRRTSNNALYARKEVYFTGNMYYTLTWRIPSSTPTGRYKANYQTWYRPYLNKNIWYRNTNGNLYTTVKK